MTPILTIGEILVEIMCTDPGFGFREPLVLHGPFPSGAPAIFIDQVARLGHPAAMIGVVGADDFGRINTERLAADGVDVSGIRVDPDRVTGSAFVRYRPDGNRDFVFNLTHSANATLGPGPEADRLIAAAGHLHVMGASLFSPTAMDLILGAARAVKTRGGSVSFDPNVRKELLGAPGQRAALEAVLALTDIYLPSGAELYLFDPGATEAGAVSRLLTRGPKVVVVKRGGEGATWFGAGGPAAHRAFAVTEADPTGAGDAFGAALVVGWREGLAPDAALRLACAAGARAVTRLGPMEGCGTRADLAALIAADPAR